MCKLKSGIILKDRVYIPDHDHHTQMLEELGIADTTESASRIFVRAELYPESGDVFSPVDSWIFNVDQDILPDWFVEEYEKQRMVEAVKKWAEYYIFIGKRDFKIDSAACYLKDCKAVEAYNNSIVKAYGESIVRAFGTSMVEAYNDSTVKACDDSRVKAYGNGIVEAYGKSTVEAYSNSTVKAYGTSTVEASGTSTVEASGTSTVKAYGTSTVKAYDTSTVKASGTSTVEAYDTSTVKAYGTSTVKAYHSSTVEAYGNSTVVIPDWSSNKRENITLQDDSTLKDCKTKTIHQSGEWKFVVVKG